jgi:hypothetical protein
MAAHYKQEVTIINLSYDDSLTKNLANCNSSNFSRSKLMRITQTEQYEDHSNGAI